MVTALLDTQYCIISLLKLEGQSRFTLIDLVFHRISALHSALLSYDLPKKKLFNLIVPSYD